MCLPKLKQATMTAGNRHLKLQEKRNSNNNNKTNRQSLLRAVCNPGGDLNNVCMNSNKNVASNTKILNETGLTLNNSNINNNISRELSSTDPSESTNRDHNSSVLRVSKNRGAREDKSAILKSNDSSDNELTNLSFGSGNKNINKTGINCFGSVNNNIVCPKREKRSELQGSSLCESNGNMMNENGKTIDFGLSRYCCNDIRNYKNNNIVCMKNSNVNKNSCDRKRKLEMNNFDDVSLENEFNIPSKKRARRLIGNTISQTTMSHDDLIKMSQNIGLLNRAPSIVVLNYSPQVIFFGQTLCFFFFYGLRKLSFV